VHLSSMWVDQAATGASLYWRAAEGKKKSFKKIGGEPKIGGGGQDPPPVLRTPPLVWGDCLPDDDGLGDRDLLRCLGRTGKGKSK